MVGEEGYSKMGESTDNLEGLDLDKLRKIFLRSLPVVALILIVAASVSTIAIRYTKPLYQSSSVIQIDVISEAKVLGFRSFDDDINNIAREIEIIKSRLFLNKVAEALDFDISYFQYGDILYEERYNTTPFQIAPISVSSFLQNRSIDLEILNEESYELKYALGGNEIVNTYNFDDTVKTPELMMVAHLSSVYDKTIDNRYFFTVNTNESIVNYINENLTVEPLDFKAKTITVSFKDYNRQKAKDIVHAVDTLYLYYTQLEKNKATKQKIDFLNEQLSQTEDKLTELESYFENFTIDNKTTNLDANLAKTIVMLEELDSQRFVLQRQLEAFNSMYDQIVAENEFDLNPTDAAYFSNNMKQELERLNTLYQDKAVLLSSYNENTLAYQKKIQEINFLKERVLQYIESSREKLYKSLDALTENREKLESEFVELPSKRTEYTKTQRYYGLYEEFYLSLMKNKAEFELAQAGTVTDYRILSSASSPSQPISPNKIVYYGIGLMAGLILSFLYIGSRYLLHNKITSQQELERASSAFVLGSVPYHPLMEKGKTGFIINQQLKSAISEAFRSIRTNLEFLNGQHEKTVISVTSTVSGEGKTFIATNLGGIISLLKNKVVVIDLDMRKPRFHEVFEYTDQSKGLSTILIKKHTIEDCTQQTELPNLDFIPAGPIPPNPSELVLGDTFHDFILELKQKYDVIIIDTPPVGLVTDGIHALKISSIPIYVFRADFSKRSYLKNVNRIVKVHKLSNLSLILNSTKESMVRNYGYKKGYYVEAGPARKRVLKDIFHFLG
jgi:capsular exopolysaccharide synthesis family protein